MLHFVRQPYGTSKYKINSKIFTFEIYLRLNPWSCVRIRTQKRWRHGPSYLTQNIKSRWHNVDRWHAAYRDASVHQILYLSPNICQCLKKNFTVGHICNSFTRSCCRDYQLWYMSRCSQLHLVTVYVLEPLVKTDSSRRRCFHGWRILREAE